MPLRRAVRPEAAKASASGHAGNSNPNMQANHSVPIASQAGLAAQNIL